MTSKNDASSQAVKVRKNLAPEGNIKAQMKVRKAVLENAQMKAATQANIDAINAIDTRPLQPQTTDKRNLAKTAVKTNRQAAGQGKTGLRNLRATAGTTKAALKDTVVRKTQAQLAREKLAAAAARKANSQNVAQANSHAQAREAVRTKTAQKVAGQQQQPGSKPGNQLIQLHPPKKAKADFRKVFNKETRKPPIINATALLAAKYPNYFADTNDMRTKAESRAVFVISSMILSLIAFGWINWNAINFQAEGDFTYNSGLIGGITMLFILLYALRKRVRLLRRAGPMEAWYYFHLLGGVLGPLIIVFHTGFTIKSINSGVALFTMITIVLSGVFGRYIYTRIGYSLHRKLLRIKQSEKQLIDMLHSYESPASEKIERRLSNFALSCLTGPRSVLKLPMRLVAIRGAAAACYVKASNDMSAMLKMHAKRDGLAGGDLKKLLNRQKEQLREHISSVADIAHAHLFERILVKWRILHIPLLYILVITGLFHVLAVHMY